MLRCYAAESKVYLQHLVGKTAMRTHKLLVGLAKGVDVLSPEWVEKCAELKRIIGESAASGKMSAKLISRQTLRRTFSKTRTQSRKVDLFWPTVSLVRGSCMKSKVAYLRESCFML
jgi:hypothetical protein